MDEEHAVASSERVEGSSLVLAYPRNPVIRLDVRLVDRILSEGQELALSIDRCGTAILLIRGGAHVSMQIAEELAAFTRAAPIKSPEALAEAKRRLDAGKRGEHYEPVPYLLFGDSVVRASGRLLHVGNFTMPLIEVARRAEAGAAVNLPGGCMQAALPLLLVFDRYRTEDLDLLARRIEEYESAFGAPARDF